MKAQASFWYLLDRILALKYFVTVNFLMGDPPALYIPLILQVPHILRNSLQLASMGM